MPPGAGALGVVGGFAPLGLEGGFGAVPGVPLGDVTGFGDALFDAPAVPVGAGGAALVG